MDLVAIIDTLLDMVLRKMIFNFKEVPIMMMIMCGENSLLNLLKKDGAIYQKMITL